MAVQLEAALLRHLVLLLLDLGVVELLDPAALQAEQVVVVAALTYRLCVFPGDRPDRADAMVVFAGGDGEH